MITSRKDLDPRFLAAMNDLANLSDAEVETHPGVPKLIATLITHAPPELKTAIIRIFRERPQTLGRGGIAEPCEAR